jgi:hypothetical protein
MSMRALNLNAEDRPVYNNRRRNLIMFWSLVVAVMAVMGAILAVDSTLTTEQRIEMALRSGMFP